jgi:hypothetical protein
LGRGLFKVILIKGGYYKIWGKMVIRKMYSVKFEKYFLYVKVTFFNAIKNVSIVNLLFFLICFLTGW